MTIEQYQERMAAMQIERGALDPDERFPADLMSVVAAYRDGKAPPVNYSVSSRPVPPFEDLSHMNPPKVAHPWLTPERKVAWIAKRKATLARKAGAK